jgi:hypothetical protein
MSAADDYDPLDDLMADLQCLVDAGLVDEVSDPGEPPRYELSPLGEMLAAVKSEIRLRAVPSNVAHTFPSTWPEPCPVCHATDGLDGGGRCLSCHFGCPPEM